ncbi:hypothetical protein EVC45_24210 [Paraburkholderia sp. UYCP14C]|uniref:hypothetical protein n=1 Tax=Paraburkholderia sp. UYCP14C TaxID=2511130 RepID=UPI00101F4486|nr:hypothetical protein [Paraburkholderia sp. UYCP14C]RZF27100.1 hypothetical protein EVC45_24210 [Paraburkholderia sp. UYCP14C]
MEYASVPTNRKHKKMSVYSGIDGTYAASSHGFLTRINDRTQTARRQGFPSFFTPENVLVSSS